VGAAVVFEASTALLHDQNMVEPTFEGRKSISSALSDASINTGTSSSSMASGTSRAGLPSDIFLSGTWLKYFAGQMFDFFFFVGEITASISQWRDDPATLRAFVLLLALVTCGSPCILTEIRVRRVCDDEIF
jgi:hypothetical protein